MANVQGAPTCSILCQILKCVAEPAQCTWVQCVIWTINWTRPPKAMQSDVKHFDSHTHKCLDDMYMTSIGHLSTWCRNCLALRSVGLLPCHPHPHPPNTHTHTCVSSNAIYNVFSLGQASPLWSQARPTRSQCVWKHAASQLMGNIIHDCSCWSTALKRGPRTAV